MTNVQQPGGPLEGRTSSGAAVPGTSTSPFEPVGTEPVTGAAGGIPTAPTRPGAHAAGTGGAHRATDTAKEEAAHLGESAKDAGRRVADTAKEEAQNVASEAKVQGKRLLDQTMHEASEQAKAQQSRAAEGMHSFGGALREMASSSQQSDLASRLVGEVGDRVDAAGRWLEQREPVDLLDEVKSFARRNPGVFIGIAAVAGLVVGRLTRGMISGAKEEHERTSGEAARAYGGAESYGRTSEYGDTRAYGGAQSSGDTAVYGTPAAYGDAGSYGSGATAEGYSRPGDSLGDYGSTTGSLDETVDPVTGLPTSRREAGL